MPETEWNSTTTPEKGTIVYVLALDNVGQYEIVQRHTLGWTSSEGADHFLQGVGGGASSLPASRSE
jgi:hypothetical protein